MIDYTTTLIEPGPRADGMHRSDSGIPREVFVHIISDENQSCCDDSEWHSNTWSSVGNDSIPFEQDTGNLCNRFLRPDAVESTYQDLEITERAPFQLTENKNNEDKSNIIHTRCDETKEEDQQRLLVKEKKYQPIVGDKSNCHEYMSFDVTYNMGGAQAVAPLTSRACTTQITKIWSNKQSRINLRTRVERMQHQMKKPFRTASKTMICSTGRLLNTFSKVPDLRLFYAMNHSLLQRGNKGHLLLRDNNDDFCLFSIPGLPSIVSLNSSDFESNGDFGICEFQELVGDEDPESLGKISIVSLGKDEKVDSEDLRWLYARQLIPVND